MLRNQWRRSLPGGVNRITRVSGRTDPVYLLLPSSLDSCSACARTTAPKWCKSAAPRPDLRPLTLMAPNGVWSPLKNAAPAQNTPSWSSSSSNQVALLAHHLQLALERRGAGDGVGRAARQADALDDGIDLAASQHGEDRLAHARAMR